MAHGKSLELASIPKRTPEWVTRHEVPDTLVMGVPQPQPANRAECRAQAQGRPWYGSRTGLDRFRPVSRIVGEDR